MSRTSVVLPAATTGVRARDASIFEVVRARYRQALALTGVVAVTLLVVSQLVFYHRGVGVDGRIQVRRGFAPLYWATLPSSRLHVDTTIDQSEVSAIRPERAALLREGAVWGVWSQRTASGLRRWFAELVPFLSPPSGERLALLAGEGGFPRARFDVTSSPGSNDLPGTLLQISQGGHDRIAMPATRFLGDPSRLVSTARAGDAEGEYRYPDLGMDRQDGTGITRPLGQVMGPARPLPSAQAARRRYAAGRRLPIAPSPE